jgi:monofunctional glycosyltransferase
LRSNLKEKIQRLLLRLILCFCTLSLGMTVLFRYVSPPFSSLMATQFVSDRVGKRVGKKKRAPIKIKQTWVPLERISCHFVRAVMAAEDQKFEFHSGFDLTAIQVALKHNLSGKRIIGGSTISQQTAKNLFLWPTRSFVRKGFEAYFTLLMEAIWSKRRIMEVYLNIIELGEGVFGAEAASKTYFNKSAKYLTKSESALLAAILPSPRTRTPTISSRLVNRRKHWIMDQMRRMKTSTLCQ